MLISFNTPIIKLDMEDYNMHFYYFFNQYKRRLKDLNKNRSLIRSFLKIPLGYKIFYGIFLIVIVAGLVVSFLDSSLVGGLIILGAAIGMCVVACIRSNDNSFPDSEGPSRSEQRITMVMDLLNEYHIDPGDSGKVKELIAYAEKDQQKHRLFAPNEKMPHAISNLILPIVGYVLCEIAKSFTLNDLILESLKVIFCIIFAAWIMVFIRLVIECLPISNYAKRQELIEDLNQIVLFYSTN